MTNLARAAALSVATLLCCPLAVKADQTTIGISLNGTTGHHVEPNRIESIPFLPMPMIEIEHIHQHLHARLEIVPPIGPVPLAQSDGFIENGQDPRVSYLNGELSYALPSSPITLGIGETIINQRTLYPGQPIIQASRVVGMRLIARAHLYDDGTRSLDADFSVNPALHGLQTNEITDPSIPSSAIIPQLAEHGSLIDTSLRWSIKEGRYALLYGVRYINYTAGYSRDGSLADRNHLFMPFVGVDWSVGKDESATSRHVGLSGIPAKLVRAPASWTTVGMNLFGTNGNRTETGAFSDTPLEVALLPAFLLNHGFGRYEIDSEATLPNAGPNPYGGQQEVWSLLTVDGLVHVNARYAFGLGETVGNIDPIHLQPFEQTHTRTEALDIVGRMTLARDVRGHVDATLRLEPDLHVTSSVAFSQPNLIPLAFGTVERGSRVVGDIARVSDVGRFGLTYGLRYVNQTTNYGYIGSLGVQLTRSTSLMPFAGVTVRP